MAGKNINDMADLLASTLPYFEKLKFGYPQKYTDHPILNRMLNKGMQVGGGKSVEWRVVVDDGGEAKHTNMYASKTYNKVDSLHTCTAPWGMLTTEWIWDRREPLMNRDAQQIVDLMKISRAQCDVRMANTFEEDVWQTITTESNEFGSLRGIPYYIAAGASKGFTGASTRDRDSTAITSCAGLSATTYSRWANYFDSAAVKTIVEANTFTTTTIEPWLRAMFEAWVNVNFKAPRTAGDLDGLNPLGNYRIYMDTVTYLAYETVVRLYNMGQQFGYDVGKFAGMTAFNKVPIERVPQLDTYAGQISGDTAQNAIKLAVYGYHPTYFVNANQFKVRVLRGDEFYEHPPIILPESGGNVAAINVDLTCQMTCEDRRSQALVSMT